VRACDDVGRILLAALATAADDGAVELGEALEQVADGSDDDAAGLAELAALFADLSRAGAAERELAVRVLRQVLRYTRQRRGA
jgi:hypothetical protein